MYDLKRSSMDKTVGKEIAAGTVIEQEGSIVCGVLEDGVEKAALVAAPAGTEKVLGFTKTADSQPTRTSNVEDDIVVPASAPFTAELDKTNIVVGRARILANGVALTIITTGTVASGEVLVNHSTGALTFHADEAGKSIVATYLYDMTLTQSKQMFGERHVNNRGLHAEFGNIEIATGFGTFYTDQFDASADYSAAGALKLGANGIITKSGAGVELDLVVVSVPSAELPLLGVRGRLG